MLLTHSVYYPPIHSHTHSSLDIHPSVCAYTHLSMHTSIICPCTHPFVCAHIHLSVHTSVCPCIDPSVHAQIHHLSMHTSLSVYAHIHLFTHTHPSFCAHIPLSMHTSICYYEQTPDTSHLISTALLGNQHHNYFFGHVGKLMYSDLFKVTNLQP